MLFCIFPCSNLVEKRAESVPYSVTETNKKCCVWYLDYDILNYIPQNERYYILCNLHHSTNIISFWCLHEDAESDLDSIGFYRSLVMLQSKVKKSNQRSILTKDNVINYYYYYYLFQALILLTAIHILHFCDFLKNISNSP